MALSRACPRLGKPAHAPNLTKRQEASLLQNWDRDIERAARAAANGRAGDKQDLAQDGRLRLLLAVRAFPEAPAPYIRAVIANTMRSALRHEFRRVSSQSPFADEVTDDIPAPEAEAEEACTAAITSWVASLPDRLQAIYRYLYVENRTQREAAKLMGVTQPRIAQMHRCLLDLGREQLVDLTV